MEQEIATQVVGLGGANDFSLWQLFLRADFVVKSVIVILLASSIYSWALIFDKYKMLLVCECHKGTVIFLYSKNLHVVFSASFSKLSRLACV